MGGDVETIVVYVSVKFALNKLFNGNWLLFKHSKKNFDILKCTTKFRWYVFSKSFG